jgi:hypothetical protein
MKLNGLTKKKADTRISLTFILFAFLLTACSSTTNSNSSPEKIPESDVQAQSVNHPPTIIRVQGRDQVVNGFLRIFRDIYFTDMNGDAVAVTYTVTSSSLNYPLIISDTPLEIPAEEQKNEAIFTEVTACWQKMDLEYEIRIRDLVGNSSEPVLVSLMCSAPQPMDTSSLLITGLSILLPTGGLLLLLFLFLFRKHPTEKLPTLKSTVFLSMVIMIDQFLQGVLHEGGHSLVPLFRGIPITLFVHPFFFSGFSRPILPDSGIAYDILGSVIALVICFLISLIFWKRRSQAFLPLVLLFPYSAIADGFNVMGLMGDFHNVIQKAGLPSIPFVLFGALIMCIGILSFFSLLPFAGLDPRENKTLFVLPASMWLISGLSLLVAHLFVPGSPIHREFFAGREILMSVNNFLFLYIGIFLALLYVFLFRRLYPRLPAWLHNENTTLTWKDLRFSSIMWAVCVVIGLIIIV